MLSPFPPSSSAPGEGLLVVHLLPHSISALSTMTFQYPLKLISPSPSAEQKSVLVFLLSYGGGLVGGDQVHLKIDVNPNAKLSIVTQGHTKIFKSPTRDVITRQTLQVTIEDGASVCLLPDPVQPFAEKCIRAITNVQSPRRGISLLARLGLSWENCKRGKLGFKSMEWAKRNLVNRKGYEKKAIAKR